MAFKRDLPVSPRKVSLLGTLKRPMRVEKKDFWQYYCERTTDWSCDTSTDVNVQRGF